LRLRDAAMIVGEKVAPAREHSRPLYGLDRRRHFAQHRAQEPLDLGT
jgi:hypothetical protein